MCVRTFTFFVDYYVSAKLDSCRGEWILCFFRELYWTGFILVSREEEMSKAPRLFDTNVIGKFEIDDWHRNGF